MKKTSAVIFYLALLIFFILPLPLYGILYPYLDHTNRENRPLAEIPVFSLERLPVLPSECTAFFTDHLPFKNELAVLGGLLDYHVFKSTASGNVLVGKKGILFYKGSQLNGEDPLADYTGDNLFTEAELSRIQASFTEAKTYLEQRGIKFLVMLPPNKERAYAQYMPMSFGDPSESCRLAQARKLLTNAGIEVVSPLKEIQSYKKEHPEDPMYFQFDTHWTRLGAYLAGRAADECLGFAMPELIDVPRAKGEPFNEDLAGQMGLTDLLHSDPVLNPYDYSSHPPEVTANELLTAMDGHALTGDESRLLLVGDSFSTLMFPYIACNYETSKMVIYYDYNEELLEEFQPDVVVFEVVERYLGNLLRFSIRDGVERIVVE